MEYRFDDRALHAEEFLRFVNQVWPGDYDPARTEEALGGTICLSAQDNGTLVGCLRILTDGYFFGTITELLVLPEYQRQGIGSALLALAKQHTPTLLYFGAQPEAEQFYDGTAPEEPAVLPDRSTWKPAEPSEQLSRALQITVPGFL